MVRRVRRRSQPRQRRNRTTRRGRSRRSGSRGRTGRTAGRIGPLALPLPAVTGRVLRVPGGRRVVDGELAGRLDGGLRVGWSSPGVAQPPRIPSRSLLTVPPGVVEHPQAVLGRPLLVIRNCPRSSDPPVLPLRRRRPLTGSAVAPDTSLITASLGPAAPALARRPAHGVTVGSRTSRTLRVRGIFMGYPWTSQVVSRSCRHSCRFIRPLSYG